VVEREAPSDLLDVDKGVRSLHRALSFPELSLSGRTYLRSKRKGGPFG
jgi:hypothetical protein